MGGERDDEAKPGQVGIPRIHPKDGLSDPQQRYFWKEEVSGERECQQRSWWRLLCGSIVGARLGCWVLRLSSLSSSVAI